jgi:hypothetical protein
MKEQSFTILQGLFIGADENTTLFLFCIAKWIGLSQVIAISIDFFYRSVYLNYKKTILRYMSVCNKYELKTSFIIFLWLFAYLIVWFYAFPLGWLSNNAIIGPKEGLENYTALLKQIPDFLNDTPIYIMSPKVIFLRFFNINKFKNDSSTVPITTFYLLAVILFILVVIAYTSLRISSEIKRVAQITNNQNMLEIHRQVIRVLIVQALLPIISIIVPVFCMILFSILKIEFSMIGFYTLLSVMWSTSIKVSLQSFFI